jgi:transposase
MALPRTRKRSRARLPQFLQKPRGVIHPRVQKVGPEHFGIVTVDPAKARSKWMLADFYGNVLLPPAWVDHNRTARDAAVTQLREAVTQHALGDVLVVVERTGRYHHVPRRAFAAAGFEVRIVHPFATKQFRPVQDPGIKTDDTDLVAQQRAAVNGFALVEAPLDPPWQEFQLLVRHRRSLVFKTSTLCCQIREHLEAALPGYAACFDSLWTSDLPLLLVRHFDSAAAFAQAGWAGLDAWLRDARVRYQRRTLEPVLPWAAQAAPPAATAAVQRRLALDLEGDRQRKTQEIQALERELARRLAQTPYVLLLSFPGLGVVSSADFAGEMGPIGNYANHRAITGRAGLYPSRYQSDKVDIPDGPLVRCANRRLRAVILLIADNLILCNNHFKARAQAGRVAGKDPRLTHVKVADRFCRIAYQLVAGGQVFRHPAMQQQSYVLDKLLAFHREHATPAAPMLADVQAAIAQLPRPAYAAEARPLADELQRIQNGRRRGPQLLGDILPIVLAKLGVPPLQSGSSGAVDPALSQPVAGSKTP